MTYPLITIGILSWNRLHYLRATLESAKRCIQYPNIQWIVLDNCSEEPGLAEYLKSCTWIDDLIILKSDHVTAMNEVVARTRGEILMLWPEDVQFIVEGTWMAACVEVLLNNPWIGNLGLNCLRRATLHRLFQTPLWSEVRPILSDLKWLGTRLRFPHKLTSSQNLEFYSLGWKEDGITGSGIPSLARTETWRKLGNWKAPGAISLNDSSGGGETEMVARWRRSGLAWQRAIPYLPVAADILTDPLGTKAKVRQNIRYGVYTPPPDGTYYYKIYTQTEAGKSLNRQIPLDFESLVKPLGFDLPLDEHGNLLKTGINLTISEKIK